MADLRSQLQAALGTGYTLERELGSGGMSRVFVAHDEALGRDVVIKVLSPELAATLSTERFTREIKLAAALQEPHIVPVLVAGQTADGLPWYTMPFVRGDSLRARLSAGRIPPGECIGILRNVAQALAYAHGQGIVHRDIKPDNVLLSSGTAVVTDFGIAKALAASKTQAPGGTITQVGTSLGTPAYMAPEQAVGDEVDARADLYSWGVMAYEMLTGRHPFADKTTAQQLIAAHLSEQPRPPAEALPADDRRDPVVLRLAPLVMRCLAKQRSERPANAGELLAALDAVLTPSAASASAATPRSRALIVAAGVLVLAAATVLYLNTRPAAAPLLEPKRVVVATFENKSGDQSLDPLGVMAADWIARGLANTGLVDVGGTAAELAARGVTTSAAGGSPLLSLARDAKAGIVISGAYYRQGDSVLFQADFTDANAGKLITSVGPVAASIAAPLDGVERLRQRVIGGLTPMVDPSLAELASVTSRPPNIEAYREFLVAEDLFYKDPDAAIPRYFKAAALDSSYLYPLVRILGAYSNTKDGRGIDSVMRVLDRHRAALTPFEQAFVEWALARLASDQPGTLAASRRLVAAAPKSQFAGYLLAIAEGWSGNARVADSIFGTLDPESGALRGRLFFEMHQTEALHVLERHDRELEVAKQYRKRYPGRLYAYTPELRALAVLGRDRELAALVTEVLTLSPDLAQTPGLVAASAVYELRIHGRPAFADSLSRRILAWSLARPTSSGSSILEQRDRAEVLMAAHQWDGLQAWADTMAAAQPGTLYPLRARGVALAMRGKRPEAEQIVGQIRAGDHRLDAGEDTRTILFILAALGDKSGAMSLLDALEDSDNRPEFTLVGELLKDYPPFIARIRQPE